jgi:hypothetical protein
MRRGDTIIEVMIAITIFCFVAVMSINTMNSGINTTEASLESTMARNEVDAQAETLRFIHNGYVAEYEQLPETQRFRQAWGKIIEHAVEPQDLLRLGEVADCRDIYAEDALEIVRDGGFIINSRRLTTNPDITASKDEVISTEAIVSSADINGRPLFHESVLSPRLIFDDGSISGANDTDASLGENLGYTHIARVEGVWVTAVKGNISEAGIPRYYDFYIRTCWVAPGRVYPTKLSTIVRLYNPANEEWDLVDEVF